MCFFSHNFVIYRKFGDCFPKTLAKLVEFTPICGASLNPALHVTLTKTFPVVASFCTCGHPKIKGILCHKLLVLRKDSPKKPGKFWFLKKCL
jgi:hypothetical protein